MRSFSIPPYTIRYKDQLVLIDWKTAEKEKNRVEDLYDNPLQVIFQLSPIILR